MGHEFRLIPPACVKPFVKRSKKDAVDAEAICEAAQRPGMRFVAVKREEQQSAGWCSAGAIWRCAWTAVADTTATSNRTARSGIFPRSCWQSRLVPSALPTGSGGKL